MRLFLGCFLPDHVNAAIDAAYDATYRTEVTASAGKVSWTDPELRHLTLCFVGEAEPGPVAERAAQVLRGFGPRSLTVGSPATMLNPTALVLPVTGADAVGTALRAAFAGVGPAATAFSGHVTVGRLRRGVQVPLPERELSVSWTADEVTLVASHRGPGQATYEVVERFALEG